MFNSHPMARPSDLTNMGG